MVEINPARNAIPVIIPPVPVEPVSAGSPEFVEEPSDHPATRIEDDQLRIGASIVLTGAIPVSVRSMGEVELNKCAGAERIGRVLKQSPGDIE